MLAAILMATAVAAAASPGDVVVDRLDPPDAVVCNRVATERKGVWTCNDSMEARRRLSAAYPVLAPTLMALSAADSEAAVAQRLDGYPKRVVADYPLCDGGNARHKLIRWVIPGSAGTEAPSELGAQFIGGSLVQLEWTPMPDLSVLIRYACMADNPCAPVDSFALTR